ncbi:CCQ_1a_G0047120.mRNA.1.CDS.1 [Saccharomyces cerevisiae]|nr:CCQ_1a_G0047120.mRNA.1.CDS.1 [Saccharomyces cerevisiae]CAI7449248.1 CCQ_1a_G0047120.mRNA.1.CDS.1 [Saccharomyces cerevisiae]
MTGKSSFYTCRALMGLFEGGFVADLVLWMSYFYSSSELSIRLSFFWVTLSLTQIITSIVAFGVFHMRGIGGMAGWEWLFLIEGIFTLVIGISAYFLMVPSIVQTKKPWSKKGWFTEREEKIIVNKILRDDPTKGDMNNRQGITD